MGFFRKEQNVHFVRDEYGRVIGKEKTGDRMGESRTPISDKLLGQQKPQQKKTGRFTGFAKKVDAAIVNYNRNRNPLTPRNRGRKPTASYSPFMNLFGGSNSRPKKSRSKTEYVVIKGKAYPIAKQKKKTKSKRNNDPFDLGFDFGF